MSLRSDWLWAWLLSPDHLVHLKAPVLGCGRSHAHRQIKFPLCQDLGHFKSSVENKIYKTEENENDLLLVSVRNQSESQNSEHPAGSASDMLLVSKRASNKSVDLTHV